MADAHGGDSDGEESFTFGSFSVEDTKEFKKNYDNLPQKVAVKKNDVAKKKSASPAPVAIPAGQGGTEAGVSALRITSSPADAPEVVADTRDAMNSSRWAQSPAPALPVPPRTADDALPAAPVGVAVAAAAAAASPPVASEEKPPPRPISWAAIAAGGAKSAFAQSAARQGQTSRAPAGLPQRSPAGAATCENGYTKKPVPTENVVVVSASRDASVAGAELSNGSATGAAGGARIRRGPPAATAAGAVGPSSGSSKLLAPAGGDKGGSQKGPSSGSSDAPSSDDGIIRSSSTDLDVACDGVHLDKQTAAGVAEKGGELESKPVDTEAVEAAKAAAAAEAAAKAKADAEILEEETWQSLLRMLGAEDGGARGTVGVGLDLVHRGLVNSGNSCFRSVVLQALLACDPFVRVLFRAAPGLRDSAVAQTALPTWAQLARFAAAFEPPKPGAPAPLGPKGGVGAGGGGAGWSAPVGRAKRRHHGISSAPTPVLPDEAMSRAFGAFRSANTGEQEDAQEYLAFFLDQLHEELVKAKREEAEKKSGSGSLPPHAEGNRSFRGEQQDAWLEVGKGRAKAVVNAPDPKRRIATASVVTGLFYGMFRSEVKKSGSAKSSVTLEPFHCLQLDLDPPASPVGSTGPNGQALHSNQGSWGETGGNSNFDTTTANNNDNHHQHHHNNNSNSNSQAANGGPRSEGGVGRVGGAGGGSGGVAAWGGAGVAIPAATSVDQALAALFAGESVAGVKGRQNLEVKASRTLTLEQAPRVLTLHLKQFSFHPEFGPRKLARRVRYPLELTIPTRIMSPSLQLQASTRGPLMYRLFTVVLHHGRSLHGGHYTALVRDARGEWRHCDDQTVSPETEGHALNPMSGHPYLLLYTRM